LKHTDTEAILPLARRRSEQKRGRSRSSPNRTRVSFPCLRGVYREIRENGSEIEPNDPLWADLNIVAGLARTRPAAWLEQSQFYDDLIDAQPFAQEFESWLELIWTEGCKAALEKYTADFV